MRYQRDWDIYISTSPRCGIADRPTMSKELLYLVVIDPAYASSPHLWFTRKPSRATRRYLLTGSTTDAIALRRPVLAY